jgi:hypothetical protein
VTRMDVEAAREDFQNRTLSHLGYDFARLIYLSSLRDVSSGEYHHCGLAQTFSESVASAAMTACHKDFFYQLVQTPLESLVLQLERFMVTGARDITATLETWEALEFYNVTVPAGCNSIAVDLYRSNIKIAMALLKARQLAPGPKYQHASQHPSLGQ